jgi:hypothetical protein
VLSIWLFVDFQLQLLRYDMRMDDIDIGYRHGIVHCTRAQRRGFVKTLLQHDEGAVSGGQELPGHAGHLLTAAKCAELPRASVYRMRLCWQEWYT